MAGSPRSIDSDVVNRLKFFRNGSLLDEVVATNATFSLRRSGTARHAIVLTNTLFEIRLRLWTTRRGAVRCTLDDGPPPPWLTATIDDHGVEALAGESVDVHFEHLHRNGYYLGLSRHDDHWMVDLSGAGYLQLAPTVHAHRQPCDLHLDSTVSSDEVRPQLAAALKVREARLVFADITELPEIAMRPSDILVVTSERGGDFPRTISVRSAQQELPVAIRLAAALRGRVLLSDRTPNPYRWTLVQADGTVARAHVDVDALDDREALVLATIGDEARR